MAISNSDWSLALVGSRKKASRTLIALSFPSFLSFQTFKPRALIFNSSALPLPLLEDASNELRIVSSHRISRELSERPRPNLDIENLNEIVRKLCRDSTNGVGAFEYYQKAKMESSFRPDSLTLKSLVRYLIKSKQWNSISSLSKDFTAFNMFPDRDTCSRLVGICIRARKFKLSDILLGIFESKLEISASAFESAMHSYNKLHMYSTTISLYHRMRTAGISPDSSCYCRIMEAYRKSSDPDRVLEVFNEFKSRMSNSTSFWSQIYFILCDSLGKAGRAREALKYFRSMTELEIPYDFSFYSSLICAFASIGEVKVAEDMLEEARKKNMVKDPVIFLKLVLMYVENNEIQKTLEILKSMKEQKIKASDCVLCAVVNGYAKKKGLKSAANIYSELISLGFEPGQVTYASIINVYCRLGFTEKAEIVFQEMQKKGFDKCLVAYANMVSMYGKLGRLRDATRLVAKMKEKGCEPNVWVYNSLMDMHGRALNLRQVEKLWKEMKRRKIVPDKVSYTSIINAYNKAKEFDLCKRFYDEFIMNGGIPDRAMAGIMVGVFSKTGRVDELVKLLQDLKSGETGLDVRLYRSAMNALRDAGLQVDMQRFVDSLRQDKKVKA